MINSKMDVMSLFQKYSIYHLAEQFQNTSRHSRCDPRGSGNIPHGRTSVSIECGPRERTSWCGGCGPHGRTSGSIESGPRGRTSWCSGCGPYGQSSGSIESGPRERTSWCSGCGPHGQSSGSSATTIAIIRRLPIPLRVNFFLVLPNLRDGNRCIALLCDLRFRWYKSGISSPLFVRNSVL